MAECSDIQTDQVHGKVGAKTNIRDLAEVCEPCKVDKNTQPAIGWCETCDELLCSHCYKYHCRPKSMRTHQLMSIAEMKKMKQRRGLTDTCEIHEGKPLEYYCADHAELGCSQCFVTKHRPCGEVVCISDVRSIESQEVQDLETMWAELDTRLEANAVNLERNLDRAARQHAKIIADIKEAECKLKGHIGDLAKQLTLKAQKRNEDNFRNINCLEEIHRGIAQKLKNGKEVLAAERSYNHILFVTMKLVQNEATVIRSRLDESEKDNTVSAYEFELSSELADVLEKVKHLGTLKDTQQLNLEKATDEVVDVVEALRFWMLPCFGPDLGNTNDAVRVSTDHDIQLTQVLVLAHIHRDSDVALTVSEGGKRLVRCTSSNTKKGDNYHVCVNVVKEGGTHGITLQAGHRYTIDVTRGGPDVTREEGLWSFHYGSGRGAKVTQKGVTITFSKTTRTNTAYGTIAGLRFTII